MSRRPLVASIGVLALGVTAAACSPDSAQPAPDTLGSTPSTVPTQVDDGVLQIGLLLPASGEGAAFGQSARAAIRVAVDRANANGGVNGNDVELFVRDEGADEVTAALSAQRLIDSHVDVIIGPASSNIAIAVVPSIVEAGVAVCSPSASALALDQLPDDGLFFRTIASDSLQADAMAEVIEQTGETAAAIAYIDDGYGRPFEAVLQTALRNHGITVAESVGFSTGDNEFTTEANRLVNSAGGVIALIGDPDAGSRMLAAVAEALGDAPRPIIVNDALRQPWAVGLLESVDSATRERIRGVSQNVRSQNVDLLDAIAFKDETAKSGLFVDQAFECANLFMLGAIRSESTQGRSIAGVIPEISSGGSVCSSFAQCVTLLAENRNIDYDGPDGVLNLGTNGDPMAALFDEFTFDSTGRDVSIEGRVSGAR